jgi:hypothetical protein
MSIKEALHESIPCVTAVMRPLYEKIDPLKFGEHRRLLSEGEEYAKRLLQLAGHQDYEEIAAKLVENYPVHDFVIDFTEARDKLGLVVKELDSIDFELLQTTMWPMTRQGFYGFIKPKRTSRKRNATKTRADRQKRLAVVPTTNKATA